MNRVLGILIIAISFLAAWLMMDFNQFKETPLNIPAGGMVYQLKAGASLSTMTSDLAKTGVLSKPYYLKIMARLEGNASKIKAGEYRIPEGTTPVALLDLLISGKVINHAFTIVEGWTFREMLTALEQQSDMEHQLTGLSDDEIMTHLGMAGEHPEGRFLPDTYHFPKGSSDVAFLKRAAEAMTQTLNEQWTGREPGLPLKSSYEALILASIIEKETGVASERPEIAGVFIRRLNKGMKLQTDPTIIYGMGEAYKGNIRRKDLTRDTPYNTYTRTGLTPTPICLPGADAIKAALHPNGGNALYFVAKGNGTHQFSATLNEHNRAVRQYQLK